MSEHKNIAQAWAAIYAGMPGIGLDATNPHFRNKYASLPNILDTIRPHLAAHGCSVRHAVGTSDDGTMWVEAVLDHVGGESIRSGPLPLMPAKKDPQGVGSALTYGRRYTVCALLGLAPDGDDDGNQASVPAGTKARPSVAAAVPGAPTESATKAAFVDWTGMTDKADVRAAWGDAAKAAGADPKDWKVIGVWMKKHTEADTAFLDAIGGK